MGVVWNQFSELMYNPEFSNGRARCLSCGTYMAKVISGRYQCRRCGRTLRLDDDERDTSSHARWKLKERVHAIVDQQKAISLPTLRRSFPDERIDEALEDLRKEGRVEIQQNGYVGDSLHHHKLVVVRELSAVKTPSLARKVHPARVAT